MKLTGKAKEDFDKWYISKNYILDLTTDLSPHTPVIGFDEIDDSMKYGVYEDWFDSVEIQLCVGKFGYSVTTREEHINKKYNINTYNKSRTAAVEKANEIYNTRHE